MVADYNQGLNPIVIINLSQIQLRLRFPRHRFYFLISFEAEFSLHRNSVKGSLVFFDCVIK